MEWHWQYWERLVVTTSVSQTGDNSARNTWYIWYRIINNKLTKFLSLSSGSLHKMCHPTDSLPRKVRTSTHIKAHKNTNKYNKLRRQIVLVAPFRECRLVACSLICFLTFVSRLTRTIHVLTSQRHFYSSNTSNMNERLPASSSLKVNESYHQMHKLICLWG